MVRSEPAISSAGYEREPMIFRFGFGRSLLTLRHFQKLCSLADSAITTEQRFLKRFAPAKGLAAGVFSGSRICHGRLKQAAPTEHVSEQKDRISRKEPRGSASGEPAKRGEEELSITEEKVFLVANSFCKEPANST